MVIIITFFMTSLIWGSLCKPLSFFGASETTTTTKTTTPKLSELTPPPQVAKYVGLEGLQKQFKEVNENNLQNTVGTLFTVGSNTAAIGTNFLNELSKINKQIMESYMKSQSQFLDRLIDSNQAVRGASQSLLNQTHSAVQNSLDENIQNLDLMTDMWMTGAKNAVSNGGSSSSINIKTSFG